MAMWLYQLSQQSWAPHDYRVDVWENERLRWPTRKIVGAERPIAGDRVTFFYAPSNCEEPGIYGWAVILRWEKSNEWFHFRPASPSNQLKMHPWWDGKRGVVEKIITEVRGTFPQATMWLIPQKLAVKIGAGLNEWTGRGLSHDE